MGRNELVKVKRETGLAYGLWALSLFGFAGIHRFYMGRWISGILWLATWGLCGVGTIIDAIMLPQMVDDTNRGAHGW